MTTLRRDTIAGRPDPQTNPAEGDYSFEELTAATLSDRPDPQAEPGTGEFEQLARATLAGRPDPQGTPEGGDYKIDQIINVRLGDEFFDIIPTPDAALAGQATFRTVNVAAFPHELLVIPTEVMAAELIALAPQGGEFDEDAFDEIVVDTGPLAAGATSEDDAVLVAGHYLLACNEAGHAHLGMVVDFTVS